MAPITKSSWRCEGCILVSNLWYIIITAVLCAMSGVIGPCHRDIRLQCAAHKQTVITLSHALNCNNVQEIFPYPLPVLISMRLSDSEAHDNSKLLPNTNPMVWGLYNLYRNAHSSLLIPSHTLNFILIPTNSKLRAIYLVYPFELVPQNWNPSED